MSPASPRPSKRSPGPAVGAPTEAPDLDAVVDKIRARGGRVTTARTAILRELLQGPHHVTVEELEQRVRATAPEVHQATLYRTLAALEELGVVYHLHLGHGPSVWHIAMVQHEHLVCRDCGSVTEVDASEFDGLRVAIAERYGFVLDTHHFVSQGLCRHCTATGVAATAP